MWIFVNPFGYVPDGQLRPVNKELNTLSFVLKHLRDELTAIEDWEPPRAKLGVRRKTSLKLRLKRARAIKVLKKDILAFHTLHRNLFLLWERGITNVCPTTCDDEVVYILAKLTTAALSALETIENEDIDILQPPVLVGPLMDARRDLMCYYNGLNVN